jgi:PqqD family protein of HPr-rel-A system
MKGDDAAASAVTVPARKELASVEVDGELVVYDEDTGSLHLLNPTAALIWQCLDRPVPFGELVADLHAAFGGRQDQIRLDVERLLASLVDRGLLRDQPAKAGAVGDGPSTGAGAPAPDAPLQPPHP